MMRSLLLLSLISSVCNAQSLDDVHQTQVYTCDFDWWCSTTCRCLIPSLAKTELRFKRGAGGHGFIPARFSTCAPH